MIINITTPLKIRRRVTPRTWIWRSSCDIGGYGVGGKEPDTDEIRSPLCSEDTAVIGIERGAVGQGRGVEDAATGSETCGLVAVGGLEGAGLLIACYGAFSRYMERH